MTLTVVTPGSFTAPGLPTLDPHGFVDTFSRPNASVLGHTEDPRRLWNLWTGTPAEAGIVGGAAYVRATVSVSRQIVIADARTPNGTAEMTIDTLDTSSSVNQFGLVFRGDTHSNFWTLTTHGGTQYRLLYIAADSMTEVARAEVPPQPGDRVRVELAGESIRGFVNDQQLFSTTSSFMAGRTSFGFYSNVVSTGSRATDIRMTPAF